MCSSDLPPVPHRMRLLILGTVIGLAWGTVVARCFGASMIDGARLGVALFCPAVVLAMRPLTVHAAAWEHDPAAAAMAQRVMSSAKRSRTGNTVSAVPPGTRRTTSVTPISR